MSLEPGFDNDLPVIDYTAMFERMQGTPLQSWAEQLPQQLRDRIQGSGHGDLDEWLGILADLPDIRPEQTDLQSDVVRAGSASDCDAATRARLEANLLRLSPWRKGPYSLFDVYIDTEWRSDMKWRRLQHHIEPLRDRLVLDVGCGSGYHCWRMAGESARLAIGIDTTLRYIIQFHAVQKYMNHPAVHVLPLNIDDMPDDLAAFDTVFSMGVMYHRRSPIDHLYQLKSCLRDGGQLVLETLVIDQREGDLLVPHGRYGKMRNVWFIPTTDVLSVWLKRSGFSDVRLVDVSTTTTDEQRVTRWMTFESLSDFLDPADPAKTIEGHPAPRRAIFTARKSA